MSRILCRLLPTLLFCAVAVSLVAAQTTIFNYQGSLQNGGSPANGNYDFEFALFDSLVAGSQLGPTLTRTNVVVAGGVFSVSLDFGNQFPGANRFLEVRVRTGGGGAYTTLSPRQQIASSPYSLKTLSADVATNATNLNNQPASFYQNATNLNAGTVSDARLSSNVARRDVSNTFTSQNIFSSNSNEFRGDGANLTNLNASQIQFGTIGDGFLSTNIPRLNSGLNSFIFGARTLQIRNDSGLVPGLNLTGTSGNLGILRLRNALEIWPSDDLARGAGLDLRNSAGAPTIGFSGATGGGSFAGGMQIDTADANTGTVGIGTMRFGGGATGEGIGSRRTVGANQWGLDFYTGSASRMSITNGGSVGIGTNTPQAKLDVIGDIKSTMVTTQAITANNLPAFAYKECDEPRIVIMNGEQNINATLCELTINVPAAGVLYIEGRIKGRALLISGGIGGSTSCPTSTNDFQFKLDEVFSNGSSSNLTTFFYGKDNGFQYEFHRVASLQTVAAAGQKKYKIDWFKTCGPGGDTVGGPYTIAIWYYPSLMNVP